VVYSRNQGAFGGDEREPAESGSVALGREEVAGAGNASRRDPSRPPPCVLMLPGCSDSSPGLDASGEARQVSLAISLARHTIAAGTRASLALVARYSDGSVQNWTRRAVWSSSASGVARMVSSGLVVGRAEGGVTVRATVGRRAGTGLLEAQPRRQRLRGQGAGRGTTVRSRASQPRAAAR
jgi:hypothetical protein